MEKKSKYRWIFIICIIIYIASIFTERGRAGQLILILFSGIYSVYYFRKKIKYSIGITCIIIISCAISYQYNHVFKNKIDNTINVIKNDIILDNPSENNHYKENIRIVLIKETINYIKKKPILGYGTGSFEKTMNKRIYVNHPKLYTTPHNTYLYVWFEIGIFGLIILLNIFYFQIKSLSKLKGNFHRILLTIGFMTIMFFDSYLFSFVLTIFYIYFFTVYNNYMVGKNT